MPLTLRNLEGIMCLVFSKKIDLAEKCILTVFIEHVISIAF